MVTVAVDTTAGVDSERHEARITAPVAIASRRSQRR
jgi:hypothetical protein